MDRHSASTHACRRMPSYYVVRPNGWCYHVVVQGIGLDVVLVCTGMGYIALRQPYLSVIPKKLDIEGIKST